MAENLSVGGVTNTAYIASTTNTSEILRSMEQEINKQIIELRRNHQEEMKKINARLDAEEVKKIQEITGISSRQMLIMKLREDGYIDTNIKNPTDADIIKGWKNYKNREIKIEEPKWA